jgi:predicted alpha/beta superfamily hydrolase
MMQPVGLFRRWAILLLTSLLAGATMAGEAWEPVSVRGASQYDLLAAGNGQRYRLFVSVPEGPVPPGGYPVLYVLDGNAAFVVAALMNRGVAARRERTGVAPALVVGIGYPGEEDFHVAARTRDYTPTPRDTPAGGGGADRFLDVLEREIKPLIAARHPVDARRQALFGHSFGGLLVVHALFTRPAAFSHYLASSPSLWWLGPDLAPRLQEFLASAGSSNGPRPWLQLSVGTREDEVPKGNHSAATLALLAQRDMLPPARELASVLAGQGGWGERLAVHELAGEQHGSAWYPALFRGLEFFLSSSR